MKASTASHAGTFLATLLGGALAIITLRWQGRDDIAVRASVIATGYTVQGVAVRATFTNDGLSGATVQDIVLATGVPTEAPADPSNVAEAAAPQCADTQDNDGDGFVDFADPGWWPRTTAPNSTPRNRFVPARGRAVAGQILSPRPRLDLLEIHTSIGRVQVHVGIQFAAWEGNRTFAPRR